jgi:hypothetical protein
MSAQLLEVRRIAEIREQPGMAWLVEGLWMHQGVGFLFGSPKSLKTWLALDLALSVASRTAALGAYAVAQAGAVLLFVAEDAPVAVRARLAGMATQRGVSLDHLPIHLVMHRSLRLESPKDQARLAATVAAYRPKLLVLDPFVRLSSIDENSSQEVSSVLASLRELQAAMGVAILVVHHARKNGGHGAAAGLALRGSGDFWAWADSTLYVSRRHEKLQLTVEHRSAPAPQPVAIELCTDREAGPYLRCCDESGVDEQPRPLNQRILDALRSSSAPYRLDDLRAAMRVRMQGLVDALRQLEQDGLARRTPEGWCGRRDQASPGETEAGSARLSSPKSAGVHPAEG